MPQKIHWNVAGMVIASFIVAVVLSTGMAATGSLFRADLADFWDFINQWKSGQGSASSESSLSDSTNFVSSFSISSDDSSTSTMDVLVEEEPSPVSLSDDYSSTSTTDEPVEEEHFVTTEETEIGAPDSDENRSATALGYCCKTPGSGERCVQGVVGNCRGGSFFHGLTEDARSACEGRFACQTNVIAPSLSDEDSACQRDPSFSVLTLLSDEEMTVLKTVIDRLADIAPSLVGGLGAAVTCVDHANNTPEEFVSAQEFEEFCEANKASWENLPEFSGSETDAVQGQSDTFPGGNFAGQAANNPCSGCILALRSGNVSCVDASERTCDRTCRAVQVTGASLQQYYNNNNQQVSFYSMQFACQSQSVTIHPSLIQCANAHRERNVWLGHPCNLSRPDRNNVCPIIANNCPRGYICTSSNVPGANCACAPAACITRYREIGRRSETESGCSPASGEHNGCRDGRALCQQVGDGCACVVPVSPCASRTAPDCGLTSPGNSTESRPGPYSGCLDPTKKCAYVRVGDTCSCVAPGQQ